MLKLDGELATIERDGDRVLCGGGARLPSAAAKSAGWGLSGLEFGVNIPGTVGGAVRMNANAYGGELARTLEWVSVCTADGAERRDARRARLLLPALEPRRGRGRRARLVRARRPATPTTVKATLAGMRSSAARRSRPGSRPSARPSRTPTTRAPRAARPASCSTRPAAAACGSAAPRFSAKHANFVENDGDGDDRRHPRADGRRPPPRPRARSASSSSPRSRSSARSSGRRTGSSADERPDGLRARPALRAAAGPVPRRRCRRHAASALVVAVLVLALALGCRLHVLVPRLLAGRGRAGRGHRRRGPAPRSRAALTSAAEDMTHPPPRRGGAEAAVADDPSVLSVERRHRLPPRADDRRRLAPSRPASSPTAGSWSPATAWSSRPASSGPTGSPRSRPTARPGRAGARLDGEAPRRSRGSSARRPGGLLPAQVDRARVDDEHGPVVAGRAGDRAALRRPLAAPSRSGRAAAAVLADPSLDSATYIDLSVPSRPVVG